ncbi:hypothetical protein [Streptomyces sp. NPDC008125]|uniref:hypothetical protein n=1 Tax=Streptomyces sp. NPDC008125 TaxID=3364811 RepID=UPI0036E13E98
MNARTRTVLQTVLLRDGAHCHCTGACGRHNNHECGTEATSGRELIAAPYPLPLTEHETAATPVSELRPWCVWCWRRATRRTAELAAELRRQQLAEAQMALPLDLFGGGH